METYHTVLAFLLAEGTGPVDCYRLPRDHVEVFRKLRSAPGRKELSFAVGRVVGEVPWKAFDAQLRSMKRHGVRAVTFLDGRYPAYLRDIARAPPILFYRGELSCLHQRGVAIVGTRNPTARACDFAAALARDLVELDIAVVSGVARGIDTAAHRGALARDGITVGVVGSGLDVPYPPENAPLLETIARRACVLGEQIMGTPPLRHAFPQRNRLISALSHAVVVVEAGRRSGALITARWALEQGREVGVVPGFPGDPRSHGVNALLKTGAFPVEGVEDILEAAPRLHPAVEKSDRAYPQRIRTADTDLGTEEAAVLDALGGSPTEPDAVARRLNTDVARVQSLLLELEIRGAVARDALGMYYRTQP
ncbi:MAG: DNA-processing protein DprA [Candidatus Krumholzibacteriia bacterium]